MPMGTKVAPAAAKTSSLHFGQRCIAKKYEACIASIALDIFRASQSFLVLWITKSVSTAQLRQIQIDDFALQRQAKQNGAARPDEHQGRPDTFPRKDPAQ